MVFYKGKQIIEGIDKIKLAIHPCIYRCINFSKQVHPKNYLTLHTTYNHYRSFHYLSIHAEYINPEITIRETIVHALHELILREVICLYSISKEQKKTINPIDRTLINSQLFFLISGITELELFFDFKLSSITFSPGKPCEDDECFISDYGLPDYKPTRSAPLICIGETLYTPNFKPHLRDSTIAFYNRAEHLLKQNQISHDLINTNPYKYRIEFRLKRNNCDRLAFNNILRENYAGLIRNYGPLLAILYRRYFFGRIFINSGEHKYFNSFYTQVSLAKDRYRGDLKKTKVDKVEIYKGAPDLIKNCRGSQQRMDNFYFQSYKRLIWEIEQYLKQADTKNNSL